MKLPIRSHWILVWQHCTESSGSDSSFRVGFYVAANALWKLDEHWGVMGGVQYQNLGTYNKIFGTRKVELDLSKSIFVTVGISYSF